VSPRQRRCRLFVNMHNSLVPALVLLVFPALYLSYRLRLYESRPVRWIGGGVLVLIILWSLPWEGVDFLYLKYMKLFLCAGVVLVLLLRYYRVGPLGSRRRLQAVLVVVAVAAVAIYYNFFSFHGLQGGQRVWVHLHDVAHYYLGSKYYDELGYDQLYTAMLRAESEVYQSRFRTKTARDLGTYNEVDIGTLLNRSEPVKERFSPGRWRDFKRDMAYFRETLGHQYAEILIDHGFNPTPVWALVGGSLSRWIPAGSAAGILTLTLLDLALLAGLFAAVGWAFGRTACLLAIVHYCVIFGTNYGWTGGGFLRYLWLFAVVVAIACLRKRHHAPAGALLALATMLRVFPFFFVLPLVAKVVMHLLARRRPPRRLLVFLGTYAGSCILLFALTLLLLPRGLDHWQEFREQMQLHVANISPNTVGLTEVLAYRPGKGLVTQDEMDQIKERRQWIYRAQLLLIFLPALFFVAWVSRRETDANATLLALPLLYLGLSLASYYYAFLFLLAVRHRRSARDLGLIFAVEAASYSLLLFEDRDGLSFVYRSVLIGFLYFTLHLPTIGRTLLTVISLRPKSGKGSST
jgi:hypothetical protein